MDFLSRMNLAQNLFSRSNFDMRKKTDQKIIRTGVWAMQMDDIKLDELLNDVSEALKAIDQPNIPITSDPSEGIESTTYTNPPELYKSMKLT